MSTLLVIWERELRGYFYAPIAYVVGVAFLAIQGFSLWSLMQALSDPAAPAPVGAVLQTLFGGTLIFWLTLFLLCALLCMRTVSEELRSGLWESTVTTRATVLQVLVGKWLALWSFYLLLWLPTIALILAFSRYVPAGASLDWGPVLASYVACAAVGALLLGIGIAASSTTRTPVVAAVLAFASYLALFFTGELLAGESGRGADELSRVLQLRAVLESCGAGQLELAPLLVWLLSPLFFVLVAAARLHPRRGDARRLAVASVLVALTLGSVGSLLGNRLEPVDTSRGQVNSLEPSTRRVLAGLDEEVDAVLILPVEEVFDEVAREAWRLLLRMEARSGHLRVRRIDPLARKDELARWAYDLAMRPEDLSGGGAVLFRRGERKRVVDLLSMASFERDALGVGAMSTFHAESAFRRALLELSEGRRDTVCALSGRGVVEASVGEQAGAHWATVAQRLVNEGVVLRELSTLSEESLSDCRVLLVAGPTAALSADETLAVSAFLEAGRGLYLGLRSRNEAGASAQPHTGLELLLEERGLRVLPGMVVDPAQETELAPAWLSYEGYAAHPISNSFEGRVATVWDRARALDVRSDDASCIMRASESGWNELQTHQAWGKGVHERGDSDGDDRCVAAASSAKGRVAVIGSALSMSSLWFDRGASGNERFLLSTLLWLLDRHVEVELLDKRPEHLRLLMNRSQLRMAFVLDVVALPMLLALLGALLYWWRRREP